MLIGQFQSKLTDKERISVPKKLRKKLGTSLVIARWYEGCLVMVSKENWELLKKRLLGKRTIVTSTVRDIDRFILGLAFEIELDRQGRFIIPEVLKNFAQITQEVVFVGLEDRVEIWSAERWEEFEEQAEEKATKAIEKLT